MIQSRVSPAAWAAMVVVLAWSGVASAKVWYVRATAVGEGTGNSWTDAFTNFNDAMLTAQPGDQVWAAMGTYAVPSNLGFQVPWGVSIYGGFVGTETALSQRNPASRTRLTGFHPYRGVVVLVFSDPAPGTVCDGFLMDGTLTSQPHGGGGMIINNGTLRVTNCTFFDNIAGHAAGVKISSAHVTFEDCLFDGNWSQVGDGGGIGAFGVGSLTVTRCNFQSNFCRELYNVIGRGAGIFNDSGFVLRVKDCTFDDNWAYNLGNTLQASGGGIANLSGDAVIENCVFTRNRSSVGGAIYCGAPTTIVNCVITGNKATEPAIATAFESGVGGGIFGVEDVDISVKSCTIAANWSKHTAAGVQADGTFENCVVYNNVSLVEPGDNPEPLVDQQFQGSIEFVHSTVAGLLGGGGPDPEHPGSIEAVPQFVIPASMTITGTFTAGDLHLKEGSPCVDSGFNAGVPAGVTTDVDGLPRFVDDPAAPNTGVGTGPLVDMGAYERQNEPSCPADFNGDGFLSGDDFDQYVSAFEGGDASADFNADGFVSGDDFDQFVVAFEAGC